MQGNNQIRLRKVGILLFCAFFLVSFFAYRKLIITAIDVQLANYTLHNHLDKLYKEAEGMNGYVSTSESSVEAVREIGAVKNAEATNILLTLASRQDSVILEGVQVEAIRQLQYRNDPRVSITVSSLLDTETPLDIRIAAADVLEKLDCNDECTENILKYLKSVADGKRNIENQNGVNYPADFQTRIDSEIKAEQSVMNNHLYNSLMHNLASTSHILAVKYGLGTSLPSKFALDVLVQIHDSGSCNLINKSLHSLNANFNSATTGTKEDLINASKHLRCGD